MDTNTIIKEMGGTSRAAKLCAVSESAIRYWRIHGIPWKHWDTVKAATGATSDQLHLATRETQRAKASRKRAAKIEHVSEPVSRVMERLKNG